MAVKFPLSHFYHFEMKYSIAAMSSNRNMNMCHQSIMDREIFFFLDMGFEVCFKLSFKKKKEKEVGNF